MGAQAGGWQCPSANREFDCILLDLNLPDGEGFSLLERIRRRGIATPVLVISAREALDDRLRALNGGADDYVIKPFMMPADRTRACPDAPLCGPPRIWRVGELEIDTVSQSVTRCGEPIGLTGREYAILRELAAASGRVVRREQLTCGSGLTRRCPAPARWSSDPRLAAQAGRQRRLRPSAALATCWSAP